MLANIKADLRTKVGGYDRRTEVESSIPSVIVEEELEWELAKTLSVQQLPVLNTGREVEIPDSQEVIPMERTNIGISQLWCRWESQEKVED